MLSGRTVLLTLGMALQVGAMHGQATLQTTLTRLDVAAARFSNAQANFHNEDYTALVRDTSTQDGITYFQRSHGSTEVGIKAIGPGARTVQYKAGNLKDYNPGTACYNTVSAQKSRSTIDSFLTLAFGTSGKELAAAWTISDKGSETLTSDGKPVKVEKLDLVAKDPGVKNNVSHIELYMDLDRGVSLKLVFYSPSGDKHTANYSKIRLNEKSVDVKPFEILNKPCR